MQINADLISYLEDLSYLTLAEEEKHRLTGDLIDIINGMAQLENLNTENIPACSHPFDNVNAFRDDEVAASFDRELILKNAPNRSNEMFIAPKTVE